MMNGTAQRKWLTPRCSPLARRLVVLAASLTLASALLTVTATRASADYLAGMQNLATGGCIHSNGYGGVYASRSCGTDWVVHEWRDRTFQFRTSWSGGTCLDDSAYGLRTFYCHAGTSAYSRFQSWYVTYRNGAFTLRNQATGRCLDDSLYGVRTFPCNGKLFQLWSWISPAPTF